MKAAQEKNSILKKAEAVVYGRGGRDYGHPKDNMTCQAALWDAYLIRRGLLNQDSEGITPRDAAIMMVLVKVAREGQVAKEDNLANIAGWAEVGQRVTTGV